LSTEGWPSHALSEHWVWTNRRVWPSSDACAVSAVTRSGLLELAATSTGHIALTKELSRDLERAARQSLGSEHAAAQSCMGWGGGTSWAVSLTGSWWSVYVRDLTLVLGCLPCCLQVAASSVIPLQQHQQLHPFCLCPEVLEVLRQTMCVLGPSCVWGGCGAFKAATSRACPPLLTKPSLRQTIHTSISGGHQPCIPISSLAEARARLESQARHRVQTSIPGVLKLVPPRAKPPFNGW